MGRHMSLKTTLMYMNPDNTANNIRPLITIATVTYNAGATLQRTLDSVAAQDYNRRISLAEGMPWQTTSLMETQTLLG